MNANDNPLYAELDRLKRERDALADALSKAHDETVSLQLWTQLMRKNGTKIDAAALWSKINSITWLTKARAALAQVRK